MACDLCGKTGTYLRDVLNIYKSDSIQAVCPDCEATINKQLRKIREVTTDIQIGLFKRFLAIFKEINHET